MYINVTYIQLYVNVVYDLLRHEEKNKLKIEKRRLIKTTSKVYEKFIEVLIGLILSD